MPFLTPEDQQRLRTTYGIMRLAGIQEQYEVEQMGILPTQSPEDLYRAITSAVNRINTKANQSPRPGGFRGMLLRLLPCLASPVHIDMT